MQTTCPDCSTPLPVAQPGTDPGATSLCQHCGGQVQTGAFLCPGCRTELQVVRSLLPAEGGNGRCPDCSEIVWVPPLAAASSSAGTSVEPPTEDRSSMPEAPAGEEEGEDATSHVLGETFESDDLGQESYLGEEIPAADDEEAVAVASAAPRSRRGLAWFIGTLLGAATALGLIVTGVWTPPAVPWADRFPFALEATWGAAAGLVGGILGLLLGGRRR